MSTMNDYEVTNLLLTTNHVGIIQQPQINQITESGDILTLDVLKNKINEIIQLLNNAEITKWRSVYHD